MDDAEALSRIDLVARWTAERAPDRVVIRDARLQLTGRAFDAAVDAVAAQLRGLGIRGGDRVVLVNENSVAFAVLILALSRLDAWSTLINARLTQSEINGIRAHCRPRATLYLGEVSPAAAAHAHADGAATIALDAIGKVGLSALAQVEPEPVEADGRAQVAVLIYTSGTTGQPKGVMLTHANLCSVAAATSAARLVSPADRIYGVLPVAHVFGLTSVFLGTMWRGGELTLVPRFNAEAALKAIAEDGITVFQGVPAMYARFLEIARARGAAPPAPKLRYLSSGGAPLDLAIKRGVEEMWGVPLHNGYGLTETAPTVTTTCIDRPATDQSTGPTLPGIRMRIVDFETGVEAAPNAIGEIWVQGPNVMKGYYRAPEETAKVLLPDGWLKTGDLGRIDERGELYVAGRLKELIIRSGFNVYPVEVEGALLSHPDVALAAVLGRKIGCNEEIVAFVQPVAGAGLDLASLQEHARKRLAAYKCPTRYVIMDELPATPAGKVLKARLAQSLDAAPAGTGRVLRSD